MTDPAENYNTIDLRQRYRHQATRVWIITGLIVLVWVGSIVAAPILDSSPIYTFFSYICHQIPERSLHLAGDPMAVCSRCLGVYVGLLLGIGLYPLWRPIDETEPVSRVWLFLSLVPITIDWSLTVFGIWENTHVTRLLTGAILGAACATFIMPALVEITQNLTARRAQSN